MAVGEDAWVEAPAVTSLSDGVVRSQSGRVLKDTMTDGAAAAEVSTYSYDAAGRLVAAAIPGHTLSYAFAGSGGCGANTAAGKDGNRTGFTDVRGAVTSSVAYCYDNADRLTSTSVTNPPVGADSGYTPVSTASPGASLAYDGHGNTTTLADQTLTYDVADRHIDLSRVSRTPELGR